MADTPRHVFLDPIRHRYAVKTLHDGKWVYDYKMLRGVISRANARHELAIQRRASQILDSEFGKEGAHR